MKIATVAYAYGTSFLSFLFKLGLNTLLAHLTPFVIETVIMNADFALTLQPVCDHYQWKQSEKKQDYIRTVFQLFVEFKVAFDKFRMKLQEIAFY